MNDRLAKELVKTRKIVKQKYRSLRSDKSRVQRQLEQEYKPITQPLRELLSNIKPDIKSEILDPERKPKDEKFSFSRIAASSSPRTSLLAPKPVLPFGGLTFLEDSFIPEGDQDPFESTDQPTVTDATINQAVEQSRQFIQDLAQQPGYLQWLEEFAAPLPRSYIDGQVRDDQEQYDHVYGIRHDAETGKFSLGNALVDFVGKDIKIFRRNALQPDMNLLFEGTPGMYELLFKQDPVGYTSKDLNNYMDILERTAAYRRNIDPTQQIQGSSNSKYLSIIRPWLVKQNILKTQVLHSLAQPSVLRERSMSVTSQLPKPDRRPATRQVTRSKKLGKGMMELSNRKLDYVYYNNPNELVERLKLLIASQMAGNSGHHNEIMSIIEELREAKIIQ